MGRVREGRVTQVTAGHGRSRTIPWVGSNVGVVTTVPLHEHGR